MVHKNNTTTIVKGIIAALLLLCLIDADYGFYQAMRAFISVGFAFLTYRHYQTGDKTNAIIYLCLLFVFQPLLIIGLGRGLCIVVDMATAGFIMYPIFTSRDVLMQSSNKSSESNEKPSSPKPSNSAQSDVDQISKKWYRYVL